MEHNVIKRIAEHKRLLEALIIGGLSLLTFIFYYPSLRYGFLFDDLPTITEYFYVRTFDPIGQFFSNSRWISRVLNQWTYKHWQTDPFGYRIVDLVMHIAIGIMIFYILVKTFSMAKKTGVISRHVYWFATIVTGLFLLHPTQTQTATYITQMRLEGLVAFFVFATLLAFVYAVHAESQRNRMILYALTTVLMMFAAGTKEFVVVAPFLVALFDWFFLAEGEWQVFKGRLVIHGVLFIAMVGTLSYLGYAPTPQRVSTMVTTDLRNNRGNTITEQATQKITSGNYFISQFKVWIHYLSIFVNPFKLSFDYDVRLAKGFFSRDVLIPLTLVLMLLGLSVYLFLQQPNNPVVFGLAWFFAALLPRASIIPSTELICDYKTFLPSFGVLFILALGMVHLLLWVSQYITWRMKQETQIGIVAVMLLMLGVSTASRNVVWTSELTFWKDVVEKAPGKSRGYNNYAVALWENGQPELAIANYKKALELDVSYGEPHVNLATIYQGMGKKELALEHYKKALDTGEVHPQLYHNLGILHVSNGHFDLAETCFKEATHYRPHFTASWVQLGKVYQIQKRYNDALYAYEQGMKGDRSQDRELIYLHASVDYQLGNVVRAEAFFAQLDKGYLDVAFQRGCCAYALRNYAAASDLFSYACSREPHNTMFQYNYAMALLNAGKHQDALGAYRKCKSLEKDLPFLPLHEAHCMLKVGQKDAAKKVLQELVGTTKVAPVKEEALEFMKVHGLV